MNNVVMTLRQPSTPQSFTTISANILSESESDNEHTVDCNRIQRYYSVENRIYQDSPQRVTVASFAE